MAAADEGIMVYPGAGADVYPLVFPHPFTAHMRQMVMYDGLPKSNYYASYPTSCARYNTEAKLIGELLKRVGLWCPAKVTATEEVLDKKYTRITLSDGRIIHYFVNTKDSEVIAGDIPAEMKALLAQAGAVFLKGHQPPAGIFTAMPKLHTIWHNAGESIDEPGYPWGIMRVYTPFAADYDSDAESDHMWIRPRPDSNEEEEDDNNNGEDDEQDYEEDDEDLGEDDKNNSNRGERPTKRRKLSNSVDDEDDDGDSSDDGGGEGGGGEKKASE